MSHRHKTSGWIVTLSLAAAATAFVALVWLPGHRANRALSDELETKREFVGKAMDFSSAMVAVQKELDRAEAVVKHWRMTAPTKRDIPVLYAKISTLAKGAGLAIERFDPQPMVVHEQLREIPITVTCTGNFGQIHEFLRSLEQLQVAIWADSMHLEKSAKTARDTMCEVNLVVFSDNL
jgi:Tfp pilus assembly protein PilO